MAGTFFSDQLGNVLKLKQAPSRIISLVPSQTELLYSLGLDKEIIGITKFCIHPSEWRQSKTIVGGTKKLRFDVIDELMPDLIIANKEENTKEDIEQLQLKFLVWVSDIITWQDAINMIKAVSGLVNRSKAGEDLVYKIENAFELMVPFMPSKVLYLIWKGPWMAAAPGTFIDAMLNKIGLQNCLAGYSRYPELSERQIDELKPDYIFLSSEPYPFKAKHIAELSSICPSSKVLLVDGEMFSWYGSRLLQVPEYLNKLRLHLF